MAKSAESALTRASLPDDAARDRAAELYSRHAAAVYRQALLMLDDDGLAEQVTRAVIVAECGRRPESPDDAERVSRRLAVSVLRRCEERAARRDRRLRWRRPTRDRVGSQDLDGKQRAVLGLVLYGGLEYREAAHELAVSPPQAAAWLRTALITMGN